MLQNILVPCDGSAFSEQAIEPAADLARRANAHLHIVRVHESMWAGFEKPLVHAHETDQALQLDEEAALAQLAERCERMEYFRPHTALLAAPVGDALREYVRSRNIDLVVMATHARDGIERIILGSVADEMIRTADVPLLLIRPRADTHYAPARLDVRHILIPLDGSPLAEAVIAPASRIAALTGARMTLLRVLQPFPVVLGGFDMPVYLTSDAAWLDARRDGYLQRVAMQVRTQGSVVDVAEISAVNVARGILDYAATEAVDMIAMSTHGRSGLLRVLAGSVANAVMHDVMMPTMVYRPHGL
jgi:nucleotide-binding universal stress UspA family protein